MKKYKNLGGGSNVSRYEIGDQSITLEFIDGAVLRYDDEKTGAAHVAQMKNLAIAGKGLYDYVKRYVGPRLATKVK